MRNLKKVLALVLALVMAMSLMVTAGATSLGDYSDSNKVTDKYSTAVDVATQLGILVGYDDGKYHPQDTLTRAQLATMTYRIATGDVDDVYTANFAGGAAESFTDTPATAWYAGYVGYAADAGYLKGMGDGTYAPNADLTGYQALAAFLRTIGYNQPGQFTGSDWTVQVAQIAKQVGALNGITGVDLNKAISREVAAQIIYNIIFTDNVEYTPAFGYQSLGGFYGTQAKNEFDLETDKDGMKDNDDWGRPSTVWYNTDNEKVVTIAETPVATHVVATSECQIATDLDKDKTFKLDIYDNGVVAKAQSIDPVKTAKTLGDQGTLIEVYEEELVIIDTYLAKVTAVNEATYDKAGHLIKDAYSDITVYGLKGINSGILDNTSYAKDTYILVNYNEATKKFEDVQAADSFVGAQTKIWTNAAQHTIDGTEYDDAAHFYLDAAGKTKTENFTWFLDQYGNVIGNIAIDRVSYAVLKDIVWIVGKPGYAEATLVYMDGSEKTVTVNTLDGIGIGSIPTDYRTPGWNRSADNRPTTLNDNIASLFVFGGVSTDSSLNGNYEGCALYRVYTNDDGTVRLDGFERGMNEHNGYYVSYQDYAVIDTGSSRILDLDDASAPGGYVYITEDTEILVREGSAGDYTYAAYNINNVPDFEDNAEIFYTYETVNGKDIATRVYVKNGVVEAEMGDHLFVTTDNYYRVAGDPMTYVMTVVVDGVERQIQTNIDNIRILAANVGKLFHVEWETDPDLGYYGFVDELRLINEEEDDDYDHYDPFCDYLTGDTAISGNRILGAEESYTITSDTVVVGAADLSKVDFDKQGVWVVASWNGKYNVADEVYVGTKLSDLTTITPVAVDATKATAKVEGNTITVTLAEDVQAADVTVTGANANTVVNGELGKATINTGSVDKVIVNAEDGRNTAQYNVVVVPTNEWENVFAKVTNASNNIEVVTGPVKGWTKLANAIDNAVPVNVGASDILSFPTVLNGASSIEYRVFTNTAEALSADTADYAPMMYNQVNVSSVKDGNVLMVEVGDGADTYYTAFIINIPEI